MLRKLLKGANYSWEETIRGNAVFCFQFQILLDRETIFWWILFFIFQVSSWMFFKIFTIKLWTSKLSTRWLFSPEIAKSVKRRAKQQRWRLWYFVIICFPFFSQKQNALVSQRTPQFGPSLLLKRIEKITNKLGKLFR